MVIMVGSVVCDNSVSVVGMRSENVLSENKERSLARRVYNILYAVVREENVLLKYKQCILVAERVVCAI